MEDKRKTVKKKVKLVLAPVLVVLFVLTLTFAGSIDVLINKVRGRN